MPKGHWNTRCRAPLSEEQKAALSRSCRKPGTAFRLVLVQYKTDAKKRGYSWELTDEEFRTLTQQPCFYGDCPPSNIHTSRNGQEVFTYNGVDRLDNSKGYTLDNCVPCCRPHNQMKMAFTLDQFYDYCERVVRCKVKKR